MFFIIFVNGLLNINTEAEMMCFADDTVILIHVKNIEELYIKANVIFNAIKSWLVNNLLELNIYKTKYIVFSKLILIFRTI